MRIGDLINILIPPAGSSSGPGGFPPRSAPSPVLLAPSIAPPNQPSKESDSADLLSLFASRSGAAAPFGQALEPGESPFANGGSILDAFVRKRAILAYRFPAQSPSGPTIDLTFDIEVAYRVIDVIPAGHSLDVTG